MVKMKTISKFIALGIASIASSVYADTLSFTIKMNPSETSSVSNLKLDKEYSVDNISEINKGIYTVSLNPTNNLGEVSDSSNFHKAMSLIREIKKNNPNIDYVLYNWILS